MAEAQTKPKPEEALSEEERMAAEWAAIAGAEEGGESEGEAVPGQSTRVLNQDEIDSLLGFNDRDC